MHQNAKGPAQAGATPERLPRDLRPRLFCAIELMLDMLHAIRSRAPNLDLESLLICVVVNEASMRRLLERFPISMTHSRHGERSFGIRLG